MLSDSPEQRINLLMGEEVAAAVDVSVSIHTHDRIAFKRCRRKWNLGSPIREHLVPTAGSSGALWFGSGFHFALEDYHGYRRFAHPFDAFMAYVDAYDPKERPTDVDDMVDLAHGMFNHYVTTWLPKRMEYQTLWLDGRPMVEVHFKILLEDISSILGREVYYEGTFDRIVVDSDKMLWIEDYKTAASFNISKLETDPQVGAYCWAGTQVLGVPVQGMLYTQFLKSAPREPRRLKSGDVSLDKRQSTNHYLYRKALIDRYGDPLAAPVEHRAFLEALAAQETVEGDKFIRRDKVYRNEASRLSEGSKIHMEILDMLDPNVRIYPNPTRDCAYDCQFRSLCLAMDDGSDVKFFLVNEFHKASVYKEEEWRKRIAWPNNNNNNQE